MNRLVFANQLRGLAALLVVVTHYLGIYFGAPQVVSVITFSPDLHLTAPSWASLFEFSYFSTGPMGVALFFLISGLVISLSLEKSNAFAFLVARLFRIFPTYLFCLALGLTTVWVSAHYWHIHFRYTLRDVLTNALLVNNLYNIPSIDAVNWTLAIELKFYLVLALGRSFFLQQTYRTILGVALLVLACMGVYAFMTGSPLHPPGGSLAAIRVEALLVDATYIIYMLIGVLFYRHLRGHMPLSHLILGSLPLLAIFTVCWAIGPQREQFYVVTLNYYHAYVVFLLCCLGRRFFRPLAVLDFFADISFPLYVVHSLLGYTLLKFVMHQGAGFGMALVMVCAIVTLVAVLVHRYVELTSNRFGKWFAARLPAPRWSLLAGVPSKQE